MEGKTGIDSKPGRTPGFALAGAGMRVAPSLLAADFSRLGPEVAALEEAGAAVLHLDVMDGHFVPNISFGAGVIASLRRQTRMFLDGHLMIAEPYRYAEPFVKAGCDHLTFHIEATDEPEALVDHIRSLGVSVGVSLNPTTPLTTIDGIVDRVDLVLLMSVWPGFGGQSFIRDVLPKAKELRGRLAESQRLQMDGGIDANTIGEAATAGVDTFVAGTAIFGKKDPKNAYHELERIAIRIGQEQGGS